MLKRTKWPSLFLSRIQLSSYTHVCHVHTHPHSQSAVDHLSSKMICYHFSHSHIYSLLIPPTFSIFPYSALIPSHSWSHAHSHTHALTHTHTQAHTHSNTLALELSSGNQLMNKHVAPSLETDQTGACGWSNFTTPAFSRICFSHKNRLMQLSNQQNHSWEVELLKVVGSNHVWVWSIYVCSHRPHQRF